VEVANVEGAKGGGGEEGGQKGAVVANLSRVPVVGGTGGPSALGTGTFLYVVMVVDDYVFCGVCSVFLAAATWREYVWW
jgi:hypothetical protein